MCSLQVAFDASMGIDLRFICLVPTQIKFFKQKDGFIPTYMHMICVE
jgi:hypothetical protein